MLCLILIVGGLLIMMGQHDRSEALFYYFRLEDQVPEIWGCSCIFTCSAPCPEPEPGWICLAFA